jgi:hypothetical protein
MMTLAARWQSVTGFSMPPGALRRGLIAGSAWGIAMGAMLAAVSAWNCGVVCVPDAALTTAISIAAGICTIGPLAAFGARPAGPRVAPLRLATN